MIAPIVISTVKAKCLPVMLASVRAYAPDVAVYLKTPIRFDQFLPSCVTHLAGDCSNFGTDYNTIIDLAFRDGYEGVVVANDDIVLTPDSYRLLMEDVAQVKAETSDPVGWVSARCDAARAVQNIRSNPFNEELDYFKYPYEDAIVLKKCLSPIFGWISRDAWECFKFPPINWFSDDVHCEDLNAAGFRHYLSRSYVHHVGSQTVGLDGEKLTRGAMPWLLKNRPHYAEAWFK